MSDTRAPALCFFATPSFLRSYITSSVCSLLLSLPYFSRIVPPPLPYLNDHLRMRPLLAYQSPEAPLPVLFPVPTGPPLTVSRTSLPDYSWIGIATNCLVCVPVVLSGRFGPTSLALGPASTWAQSQAVAEVLSSALPLHSTSVSPRCLFADACQAVQDGNYKRASTQRQNKPASSFTQPPLLLLSYRGWFHLHLLLVRAMMQQHAFFSLVLLLFSHAVRPAQCAPVGGSTTDLHPLLLSIFSPFADIDDRIDG